MKRVKEGEKYWYIGWQTHGYYIGHTIDIRSIWDDKKAGFHNYFHTREEAESMVRKLRAVLKGADVIKMPSKNEVDDIVWDHAHKGGYAHDRCYPIFRDGWETCYEWLKGKIIK